MSNSMRLAGMMRFHVALGADAFYIVQVPRNNRKRRFSEHHHAGKKSTYIDQWFQSIAKPPSFYEQHANANPIRRYFYTIDLQGRLFLEETIPKNIATSIKDVKFLDFFFRRIRHVDLKDQQALQEFGAGTVEVGDYPYVSPCGKERNFIRPAATPIVFHSLANEGKTLVYGGTMTQPLDYSRLAVSRTSGRLYHQLISIGGKNAVRTALHDISAAPEYGLIRSSVAVALSERIVPGHSDEENLFILTPQGDHPLPWLPEAAEPGAWALPRDECDE